MRSTLVIFALACAPALAQTPPTPAPTPAPQAHGGYVKEREVPLEGGTSMDFVHVDSAGGKLYVAHSPVVDVLELSSLRVLRHLASVAGAHGSAELPAAKR